MVHKTFLKHTKKIAIPFSAISSGLLFSLFNTSKVLAANVPSEKKSFFERYIIDINEFKEFKDKFSPSNWIEFKDKFDIILDKLIDIMDFFLYLPHNVSQFSIDFLSHMFELITKIVLQTPLIIFDNPYIKDANFTFSVLTIFIVSLLTMIESIKQMIPTFKNKYTPFDKIIKRYALVISVSGFAPFIFEKVFQLLNILTKAILEIGSASIHFGNISDFVQFTALNTLILISFDLAVLAFVIPIFLQNGRRWFDILTLSTLTPLALTSWIFDDYKYLFHRWFDKLKQLGLVQVVYAIFIVIMTLFIFGTRYITSGDGLIIKLLIIIGGFWRMLNPPNIVTSKIDTGKDVIGMGKDLKRTFKETKNTLKGKPINLNPIKNYIKWVKGNLDKDKKDE